MKIQTFHMKGPVLIQPNCFFDSRGFFLEAFKVSSFSQYEIPSFFMQDNHSRSSKNVLRGLHLQVPPKAQGKLIRVTRGRALDVIVDIRKGSPTYGEYLKIELSEENKMILWVPPGFAHGFLTLEDKTDFLYKLTNEYSKEHERGIHPFDPHLKIDWGISEEEVILSEKDKLLPYFENFESPFEYEI